MPKRRTFPLLLGIYSQKFFFLSVLMNSASLHFYPQNGLGKVFSVAQSGSYPVPVYFQVWGLLFHPHSVSTCRTFVRHYVLAGKAHVFPVYYFLNHFAFTNSFSLSLFRLS
jgi:hypothetical protein